MQDREVKHNFERLQQELSFFFFEVLTAYYLTMYDILEKEVIFAICFFHLVTVDSVERG